MKNRFSLEFRMIPSKYEEQNSVLVGGIDILHADAKDAGEYSCRTPGAKQSLAVVVTGKL